MIQVKTIEESIKMYESYWSLFSDMLAKNAPFYYFIHTVISTNRDLNKGFQKVLDNKVCVVPIIRTALENTLICYEAYILKDSKLDTFTRRYMNGQKLSTITISLPPEEYNRIIKHPEEKDATRDTEVNLTNSNLTKLLEVSVPNIREIYLECCANIHPTKEQNRYYIKQTGYIEDKMVIPELSLTPEEQKKYVDWMLLINNVMETLLWEWVQCYNHIPFDEKVNGTDVIADLVNKELPHPISTPEEIEKAMNKIKHILNTGRG